MKKLIAMIMFILLLMSIPGICGAVRAYKEDAGQIQNTVIEKLMRNNDVK